MKKKQIKNRLKTGKISSKIIEKKIFSCCFKPYFNVQFTSGSSPKLLMRGK